MLTTHICIALGPWELRWTFALGESAQKTRLAEHARDDGAERDSYLQRQHQLRPVEVLGQTRAQARQTGMVDGKGVQDRW